MSTSPLSTAGPFGKFADELLSRELPDLPESARADTVRFVCRRADEVPTPLKLGVIGLSMGVGGFRRIVGAERTTDFLRRTSLPFVGELARMVRSLGFTYVWETWPESSPTGAPQAAANR